MRVPRYAGALLFSIVLLTMLPRQARAQEPWQPLMPEELLLKDNPKSPGSDAMILYREFVQDDHKRTVTEYVRLKIFTEVGRRYANVETMHYNRGDFKLTELRGRTIQRDGQVTSYTGKPFESVSLKFHSYREVVTSFVMPDVTPGSIVEYAYTLHWDGLARFGRWDVPLELFQRKVHFGYIPEGDSSLLFATALLPAGVAPVKKDKGYTMDMRDVPAFEEEVFMPPETEGRPWVMFFSTRISDSDDFWESVFTEWSAALGRFLERPAVLKKELDRLVDASDSNQTKLRKIYQRVQSLPNVAYEPEDSAAHQLSLKKFNSNVEDVVKHGYGWPEQLNSLFVSLARAAGMDATVVVVTPRDRRVFRKEVLSFHQFSAEVAMVRDGGKEFYFDPGNPLCPFGVLPWEFTGVTGARWDPKSVKLVMTPLPDPADAGVSRKGEFKLLRDGTLDGTVEVTFTGQDALSLRLRERNQDDAGRQQRMETMAQKWFLTQGQVTLTGVNDWKNSQAPLVVTYQVHLPGYAEVTGQSLLLPGMVFAGTYRSPFTHTHRNNPIYFPYPGVMEDQISIAVPDGYAVGSLPEPKSISNALADFSLRYTGQGDTLWVSRQFRLKAVFVGLPGYPGVQSLYARMQQADEDKVILQSAPPVRKP
jgi:hypothetical protein